MSHKFVILKDGIIKQYDTFESIPETFDNVIEFMPHIPEGPHTEDQHLHIEMWNDKLQELMKREKNASSN
jgi:hypothetical protein